MAITARLIGKLGGADIEAIPVSMSGTGNGTEHLLHRVTIPSGERRMIAIEGTFTTKPGHANYSPTLLVGEHFNATGFANNPTPANYSGGGVLSQTGDVSIMTQGVGGTGQTDFSGMLYIVPLD